MAKRLIHLVRHGQHKQLLGDASQAGLSDVGIEQAKYTAKALRGLPVTVLVCSTLPRTVETASIISKAFPEIEFKRSFDLGEVIPYIPEADADFFHQQFPDYTAERVEEDREQAEAAFEKHFFTPEEGERHRVIVCHGNLLRFFVCRVLDVPLDSWTTMEIYNCGISRVMIESSGRMRLISHNDIGHLPPRLRTPI